MKKTEIYGLEILLFICIIIFNILYDNNFLMDISILIIGIIFIKKYGIMKDNNYLKNITTKIVISSTLCYFIAIYLLGLVLGFNNTIFKLNLNYIITVVILGAGVIIIEEIIRYIICRNTPHQKLPIIIYTILISILNIIIEINGYDLSDTEMIFIFLTTVVIPTICIEMICSYLTYKVSYIPSMVYKLSIVMYQFILPIIPNLGNYLYSITNVALPYVIYYTTSKLINYKSKQIEYQKQVTRRVAYIPIIVFLIIVTMLVSGIFSHTIIAIGSNSMSPTYDKGDAIIYKKAKAKNIEVGQVLVFKKDGKIVTHRIINKTKLKDKVIFQTKGDANKTKDAFQVEENNVIGVVKYSVKYIGYPTIWFNDIATRKETNS